MPETDRFEGIYQAVTYALLEHIRAERKADQMEEGEANWFEHVLIPGFWQAYRRWPAAQDPSIAAYLRHFDRRSTNRDVRLAAHVFLHIGYDLPRVIADSLLDDPNRREPGRRVFLRAGPLFLRLFLNEMRRGTFGLLGRVVGVADVAQALGYWMVALRSAAWIHAESLVDLRYDERQRVEGLMASAMWKTAEGASSLFKADGIARFDNAQLTGVWPWLGGLPDLTPAQAAAVTIGAAAAGAIVGQRIHRNRVVARIEIMGALTHRNLARALDLRLAHGEGEMQGQPAF